MAGDQNSLKSLQKPQDLQSLLREDRGDDCLSCRVIGSGAFFGLAIYSFASGMSQLEKQRDVIARSKSIFGMRSRQAGIVVISLGMAYMGAWRAFR